MRRESEQIKSSANVKGTLKSTRLNRQELKRLTWTYKWKLQWTGNSRMNRNKWYNNRRWLQTIRSGIPLKNLSKINKWLEIGSKCSADRKSRRPITSKWWLHNRKKKPATNVNLIKLRDKIVLANRSRRNCKEKPMNNNSMNRKCKKWKKKNSS